jgi:hypothetical protein
MPAKVTTTLSAEQLVSVVIEQLSPEEVREFFQRLPQYLGARPWYGFNEGTTDALERFCRELGGLLEICATSRILKLRE